MCKTSSHANPFTQYMRVYVLYKSCLSLLHTHTGHPVWNLRTKTPQNEQATVPWHQDNAYLDQNALYTLMPTAWIPLIDANVHNGCMQVR